jgi:hypothetical protein
VVRPWMEWSVDYDPPVGTDRTPALAPGNHLER